MLADRVTAAHDEGLGHQPYVVDPGDGWAWALDATVAGPADRAAVTGGAVEVTA